MYQNDRLFYECGNGWKKLIDPVVAEIDRAGGRVDQVKEKYGTLRIYWSPPDEGSYDDYDLIEGMINNAELESARTCEICGERGSCLTSGGWLKTLCPGHATEIGYHRGSK